MPALPERPFYPHRSSIFSFGGKPEFAGLRINSFINRRWAFHPDIQILAKTLGDFDEDPGEDLAAPWIRQSFRESSFSVASSSLSTLSDGRFFDIDTPECQTLAIETAKVQVHKLIPTGDVKRVDSPIITSNLENTQHDVCGIVRSNSLSLSTTSWDGLIEEHWFPKPLDACTEETELQETSNRDSHYEGSQSDSSILPKTTAFIPKDDAKMPFDVAPSIPPRTSSLFCGQSVSRRQEICEVTLPDYGQRSATCSAKLYHLPVWNMDIRTANSITEALHDGEYHDGKYHDLHEICPSGDDLNFSQDYTGSETITFKCKTHGHLCNAGNCSIKPGLKYHVRRWWSRLSPLSEKSRSDLGHGYPSCTTGLK